jgi:hypothetical protein
LILLASNQSTTMLAGQIKPSHARVEISGMGVGLTSDLPSDGEKSYLTRPAVQPAQPDAWKLLETQPFWTFSAARGNHSRVTGGCDDNVMLSRAAATDGEAACLCCGCLFLQKVQHFLG